MNIINIIKTKLGTDCLALFHDTVVVQWPGTKAPHGCTIHYATDQA